MLGSKDVCTLADFYTTVPSMCREADKAADLQVSSHAPAGSTKDSFSSFWDDLSLYGTLMGEDECKEPGSVLPVEVCLQTDRKAGGPRK